MAINFYLGQPHKAGNSDVIITQNASVTAKADEGVFVMYGPNDTVNNINTPLIVSDGTKCVGVAGVVLSPKQALIKEGIDVLVRGESGLTGVEIGSFVYVSDNGLATNVATGRTLIMGTFRSGLLQGKTSSGDLVDDCYFITLNAANQITAV